MCFLTTTFQNAPAHPPVLFDLSQSNRSANPKLSIIIFLQHLRKKIYAKKILA